MGKLRLALSVISTLFLIQQAHGRGIKRNLLSYGAIPDCSFVKCAQRNGLAFFKAVQASKPGDSVVIGQHDSFYYIPQGINATTGEAITMNHKQHITIELNGEIILHDDTSAWPMNLDNNSFVNAFHFSQCIGLKIQGGGTIQGQGEIWWREFFFGKIVRQRPTLIYIEDSNFTVITDITLLDSPRFNIYASDIEYLEVCFCTIWIDVAKQRKIYEELLGENFQNILPPFEHFDNLKFSSPVFDFEAMFQMFPFNTDGVDFHGRHVHVHDLIVSNYDDVIAVKASHNNSDTFICTENVLVERISIFTGVGLSIGSVPPGIDSRCVRNITFRDIHAQYPIKLIYIKTGSSDIDNDGDDDYSDLSGIIENILYENITAGFSLLEPIYIGPQQQKEPDGTGQGFFNVPTEPRIEIRNVTLRNISVTNNMVRAGLLRCNHSNPCTHINFENVKVFGRLSEAGGGFICDKPDDMFGTIDTLTTPDPSGCVVSN